MVYVHPHDYRLAPKALGSEIFLAGRDSLHNAPHQFLEDVWEEKTGAGSKGVLFSNLIPKCLVSRQEYEETNG